MINLLLFGCVVLGATLFIVAFILTLDWFYHWYVRRPFKWERRRS